MRKNEKKEGKKIIERLPEEEHVGVVALYIAAPYRRLLIKTSNKGVAADIRAIRNEIEGKREEKGCARHKDRTKNRGAD